MLKKYNIALTATEKRAEIIALSQHFSKISDQYQLGKGSLPHVTLCQFHVEEREIDFIWESVCEALPVHILELEFKDFSCITFNKFIFWVSLMPDQRFLLNKMHQIISSIIKSEINKSYDPHMTLINTKDPQCKTNADELAKSYFPIKDTFILSIGECDSVGQFTKLIKKCELKHSLSSKLNDSK